MANTQWLDRSQPQTLYFANMLLYFDAGWWLLYLLFGLTPLFALLALPAVFAGLGIANEKKIGYWGAVVVAVLNLAVLIAGRGGPRPVHQHHHQPGFRGRSAGLAPPPA